MLPLNSAPPILASIVMAVKLIPSNFHFCMPASSAKLPLMDNRVSALNWLACKLTARSKPKLAEVLFAVNAISEIVTTKIW